MKDKIEYSKIFKALRLPGLRLSSSFHRSLFCASSTVCLIFNWCVFKSFLVLVSTGSGSSTLSIFCFKAFDGIFFTYLYLSSIARTRTTNKKPPVASVLDERFRLSACKSHLLAFSFYITSPCGLPLFFYEGFISGLVWLCWWAFSVWYALFISSSIVEASRQPAFVWCIAKALHF